MFKSCRYFMIILTVGLLPIAAAQAAIINAPGCGNSEVQTALNSASDGDTVVIPAGTCSWTSPVTVPAKALTLKGAGMAQTVIIDQVPKTGSNQTPLVINTIKGKSFRLSGLTLAGGTTASGWNGTVIVGGTGQAWRIDNVKFDKPKSSGIRVFGHTYGVIDHCVFNMDGTQGVVIWHNTWNGTSYGDGSWADPLYLGTEKAVYLEDNTFTNSGASGAIDSMGGARWVFRYNTVNNDYLTSHGTETTGRIRGLRSYEIYNNTFTFSGTPWFTAIYLRGGTGVVFSNTLNGYDRAATAANYRDSNSYTPWGKCDGTSPYDGNQSTGYPCIDQIGRSTANPVSGDPPLPQSWPQQVLEPLYGWNNTLNGGSRGIESDFNSPDHIKESRDFYNLTKPGYTPYRYPHPLVSSAGPNAPRNLRIVP